jgi:hypothetical protein
MKSTAVLVLLVITFLFALFASCEKETNEPSAPTNTTIVPNNPSNLIVTVLGPTSVQLRWQDNSTNEEGFRIERRIGSATTFIKIDSVGLNVNQYTDNGLFANTVCCYRVCAFNTKGNSQYTNESSATTHAATSPRTGNWTGVYGSGKYGLSFKIDNSGYIHDFMLTATASGCGGSSMIEIQFTGPDTIETNNTFTFKTPSAYGADGSGAFVTLNGTMLSDTSSSGTFTLNFWKGLCGGISRDIQWQARKSCTLKPTDGDSKNRFCP